LKHRRLFAPLLAIAFYGNRAHRIFKGDAVSAVRDLVWLHAIGLTTARSGCSRLAKRSARQS
jgi:hypothetical protein